MTAESRRRIDRILDPAYVEDLEGLATTDLRRRLEEAREEEGELSYTRRLLQGEIDVLRAELESRQRGEEPTDPGKAVDRLSKALADRGVGGSRGARPRVSGPREAPGPRVAERLVAKGYLARLPDLSPEEISEGVSRLVTEEERLSADRRRVHGVIDALEAELVRRYKAGSASPSEVLGSGEGPRRKR